MITKLHVYKFPKKNSHTPINNFKVPAINDFIWLFMTLHSYDIARVCIFNRFLSDVVHELVINSTTLVPMFLGSKVL